MSYTNRVYADKSSPNKDWAANEGSDGTKVITFQNINTCRHIEEVMCVSLTHVCVCAPLSVACCVVPHARDCHSPILSLSDAYLMPI